MPVQTLKAPVGLPGKSGAGKQVKNTPADVIVLRRMLVANGYKLPEEGKYDAKLGAVIKGAQKKAGIKPQDGVIQPGDKVCKALSAKYMAAEKAAANVKMVTFKIGGTSYEMTPADYEASKKKLFKTIESPTRRLIQKVDYTMDRYQFYLDTAMLKDGIAMAMVQASIMTIGRIKFPDDKKMLKALDAKGNLEVALKAKDLKAYCEAMRTAERDINAFVKEFRDYVQKMEGNGKAIQGSLEVVKSTSFAAAEVLAVPVIVAYTRMPPDKAYMVSKTASAGIESLATDLGKTIAGQKVTASGSLGRAGYAMAKELVLSWCGGKIKFEGKLLTRMMKVLGPALTKAFPFIPKGAAANFAARYIKGFGEEALKGILEALIKGVESWIKKGTPPSKAEIEKLFDDVVMKAVLGGLGSNLGKFHDDWAAKSQMVLRHKLVPMALKKIDKKKVVNAAMREDLIKRTIDSLQGKSLDTGYKAVFDTATGHESAAGLTSKAEKALRADASITKQIEKLVDAQIKDAESVK